VVAVEQTLVTEEHPATVLAVQDFVVCVGLQLLQQQVQRRDHHHMQLKADTMFTDSMELER
jgi:hypothetical protein